MLLDAFVSFLFVLGVAKGSRRRSRSKGHQGAWALRVVEGFKRILSEILLGLMGLRARGIS